MVVAYFLCKKRWRESGHWTKKKMCLYEVKKQACVIMVLVQQLYYAKTYYFKGFGFLFVMLV